MNRIAASLVAALGLAALALQLAVLPGDQGLGMRIWLLSGYFTVLTNLAVTLAALAVAAGLRTGPRTGLALTTAILMVAAVYHSVLAALWDPQGWAWWADQGLHTAVPLAWAAWWLAFSPKAREWSDLPAVLAWPLAYCALTLIRGTQTNCWPYPFLDANQLSPGQMTANITGLALAFAALGAGLIALGRTVSR